MHFVEIEPPVPAKHTIIWLHGLGADGNDFVPIVSELNLPANNGIRFIFPHAPIMPVTLNNGYEMRAWYDIYSLTNNHRVDESGIVQSLTSINELIEAEIARGISSSNILLAGFSQGAAIALTAGLHYQQTLAGIIALSGYLPLMEKTFDQANESNRKIPIFIAHGTQDSVVPYAAGKAAETLLRQAGYTVEWHHYAMQHSVCAEEMNDIGQWIKNILF
ncbi:MAG: carboxylesterase [Gammaproteobacteria bacterium RIFCSPHIGHO2_12_FULL_37_14]|nr:MAG: carboxylesterase [Gammaproteobacteria bacterium RIFCSPHIGHO2_12_FULL_37_14]